MTFDTIRYYCQRSANWTLRYSDKQTELKFLYWEVTSANKVDRTSSKSEDYQMRSCSLLLRLPSQDYFLNSLNPFISPFPIYIYFHVTVDLQKSLLISWCSSHLEVLNSTKKKHWLHCWRLELQIYTSKKRQERQKNLLQYVFPKQTHQFSFEGLFIMEVTWVVGNLDCCSQVPGYRMVKSSVVIPELSPRKDSQ